METFIDVKNYENLYEVSNYGNVKSLPRYNIDKNGKKKFYPGKLLAQGIFKSNTSEYRNVRLSKNGKVTTLSVHRLVAFAFITNDKNKPFVNHLDNDGSNNNYTNLEWCTHSENMIHAQKQGRLFDSQSKGGKVIAKMNKDKAIENINNNIGLKSGLYEVIRYGGMPSTKHHAICLCHGCNKEFSVYYGNIQRNIVTGCKSCSKKRKI